MSDEGDFADAETDRLFATVGRYVILFQLLEGKVDECLLLLWGHENWERSQARLAGMTNADRVNQLKSAFHECPENARGRTRAAWVQSFDELIELLHAEREHRNGLLHSGFMFHFLEIGHPVLMVDRKARKTGRGDTALTQSFQESMLDRILKLYLRTAHAHTQLIHDYGASIAENRGA